MLFRIRLAGLVETGLDLSDLAIVFWERARTNPGGETAAVAAAAAVVPEGTEVLVLIVESGLPPIGKSGSRLCFIRFGAENCLLSSSSFTCFISGCVPLLPPFPSDSGAVDAGACVLPDKFSELCERRGEIGCS